MCIEQTVKWPVLLKTLPRIYLTRCFRGTHKSSRSVICTMAVCEGIVFHFAFLIRLTCSFGRGAPSAPAIRALSSDSCWAVITSSFVHLLCFSLDVSSLPSHLSCSFPSPSITLFIVPLLLLLDFVFDIVFLCGLTFRCPLNPPDFHQSLSLHLSPSICVSSANFPFFLHPRFQSNPSCPLTFHTVFSHFSCFLVYLILVFNFTLIFHFFCLFIMLLQLLYLFIAWTLLALFSTVFHLELGECIHFWIVHNFFSFFIPTPIIGSN